MTFPVRLSPLLCIALVSLACGDDTASGGGTDTDTDGSTSTSSSTSDVDASTTTTGIDASTTGPTAGESSSTGTPDETTSSSSDGGTTSSSGELDTSGEESSSGSSGGEMPLEPPCPAGLIGPMCERQYVALAASVAADGNDIFFADFSPAVLHHQRDTGLTEVFSTVEDPSNGLLPVGTGADYTRYGPAAVVPGGPVYVIEGDNDGVLEIERTTGDRQLISGPGVGTGPTLDSPSAIAWDPVGMRIIVTRNNGTSNDAILTVDPNTGDRVELSHNANNPGPSFSNPAGVAVDPNTGIIYVVDPNVQRVFSVDPDDGTRTTVSSNSMGEGPDLGNIRLVTVTDDSRLFIGDRTSNDIVEIDLETGDRTTVASEVDGVGDVFLDPFSMSFANGELLVFDSIRVSLYGVDPDNGDRTVVWNGTLGEGHQIGNNAEDIVTDGALLYTILRSNDVILEMDPLTGDRTIVTDGVETGEGPGPDEYSSLVFVPAPDRLFVTDATADALVSVDIATGDRTIISDDDASGASVGAGPGLDRPEGLAIDIDGDRAFVADVGLRAVVLIDLVSGDRSVLSDASDSTNGGAQVGTGPAFIDPQAIAYDPEADELFVGDRGTTTIYSVSLDEDSLGNRVLFSSSAAATPVGDGPALWTEFLWLDAENGRLVTSNDLANTVMAIDLSSGDRTTLSEAGSVGTGWAFGGPHGVTVLDGLIYVADNDRFVSAVDSDGNRTVIASGATVPSVF